MIKGSTPIISWLFFFPLWSALLLNFLSTFSRITSTIYYTVSCSCPLKFILQTMTKVVFFVTNVVILFTFIPQTFHDKFQIVWHRNISWRDLCIYKTRFLPFSVHTTIDCYLDIKYYCKLMYLATCFPIYQKHSLLLLIFYWEIFCYISVNVIRSLSNHSTASSLCLLVNSHMNLFKSPS